MLACVYVFGHRLRATSHHRRWVSIAAGVSVSTVFLDLLPEISEGQTKFSTGPDRGVAFFPEQAIYLFALLGFVLFYGLEYMVAASPSEDGEPRGFFSALRIAAFAAYSGLIAYLLVHNVWKDAPTLLLYTLAMGFHFLLVDHSLFSDRYGSYEGRRRWILALAVLAGWSVRNPHFNSGAVAAKNHWVRLRRRHHERHCGRIARGTWRPLLAFLVSCCSLLRRAHRRSRLIMGAKNQGHAPKTSLGAV